MVERIEIKHPYSEKNLDGKTLRLIFTGASSVGKTTLARIISDTYGVPLIEEVARNIMEENRWTRESLRDTEVFKQLQQLVLIEQIRKEIEMRDIPHCSDRSIFDPLVFAEYGVGIDFRRELELTPGFKEILGWYRDSTLFLVEPDPSVMEDDGTRIQYTYLETMFFHVVLRDILIEHEMPFVVIDKVENLERQYIVDQAVGFFYYM